jgi:hypothetical protein
MRKNPEVAIVPGQLLAPSRLLKNERTEGSFAVCDSLQDFVLELLGLAVGDFERYRARSDRLRQWAVAHQVADAH